MNQSSTLRHSASHRAKLRQKAIFKGWGTVRPWEERQNMIKPGRIMSEAESNAAMRRAMDAVDLAPRYFLRGRLPEPPVRD